MERRERGEPIRMRICDVSGTPRPSWITTATLVRDRRRRPRRLGVCDTIAIRGTVSPNRFARHIGEMREQAARNAPEQVGRQARHRRRTRNRPGASSPGVSFRYSYTEISAVGNTASVRRREMRFENGMLKSESFEGTLDRGAFDEIVRQTHGYLLAQTSLWMKSLFWFLPARARDARENNDSMYSYHYATNVDGRSVGD